MLMADIITIIEEIPVLPIFQTGISTSLLGIHQYTGDKVLFLMVLGQVYVIQSNQALMDFGLLWKKR
jgi:hypothetical protein